MQIKVLFLCFTLPLFYLNIKAQISDINFTSSNLPIIIITTENNTPIVDEPKVTAHMGVIYGGIGFRNEVTDPFNHYDGPIGIELRGNASLNISDKKPYTFETRNADGTDVNVELFGFPAENDFILRAAYIDKTLMRDPLAYYMARTMGRWAPRTQHIELIINGNYKGVYILVEKIKPDKNRLDINRMNNTDISGDELTGGYVWSVQQRDDNDVVFDINEQDGNFRVLKYPKGDKVTPEQLTYIHNYEESFCRIMEGPLYNDPQFGYPVYINIGTFIDEIIYQEATSNSDAYGWSSFFHKDRLGKMCAGPAWDFDQALSNSTYNDGERTDEWIIEKADDARPPFWQRLWDDPDFKKLLVLKWTEYRKGPLHNDRLFFFIDSLASYLDEAQEHNFSRWPILGVAVWRSLPGATERDTYQKEVDYMKDWLEAHLVWMDEQLIPVTNDIVENEIILPIMQNFQLGQNYPNPFNPTTKIPYSLVDKGKSKHVTLEIYNQHGQKIRTLVSSEKIPGKHEAVWDARNEIGKQVANGIYIYRINISGQTFSKKMLFIK